MRAAPTEAPETNPPIPRMAPACLFLISSPARWTALRKWKMNFPEPRIPGQPTAGISTPWAISPAPTKALRSTAFGEIKKLTSWPRRRTASATANPGNRCPPVPPHAITSCPIKPITFSHLRCDGFAVLPGIWPAGEERAGFPPPQDKEPDSSHRN